jgi:hypothetical protein
VAQSQYRLALSPAWRRFHLSFYPILAQGTSTMHPAHGLMCHPRLQKDENKETRSKKTKPGSKEK